MTVKILTTILITIALCSPAAADFITDEELKTTKTFLAENPRLPNTALDEIGLVDLWQRTPGIKNMTFLFYKNDLPPKMAQDLHTRIHLQPKNIGNNLDHPDPVVAALARLMRLNNKHATKVINGSLDYYIYADIANYTIEHGRVLAEMVETKYNKGNKIIKPAPEWK